MSQCAFWCLVLSDVCGTGQQCDAKSCVSMHLLVLGAFRLGFTGEDLSDVLSTSQCTFWCLVLSDKPKKKPPPAPWPVASLNAPSGAWCFPTRADRRRIGMEPESLNAPSGAWCFPTCGCGVVGGAAYLSQCTFWCLVLSDGKVTDKEYYSKLSEVSMHLLVLGAFRQEAGRAEDILVPSQCTFWCLVLSDVRR